MKYHTPQSSCYIEIVRVRFRCKEYIKAHIKWYSKPSGKYMCEERNVKILNKNIKYWKSELHDFDLDKSLEEV